MSLRRELREGVLVLTIDRPEARNALDAATQAALIEEWRRFRDDDMVFVAVLTGAGEAAFCAGADLKELGAYYRSMSPHQRHERGERQPGLGAITRNFDPRKPTIAAINGACLAGGLELALACDIRVAADHARFGLPEVCRGILPGAGGTQRLARALPLGVALEMILSGAPIDAEAALRWGLVSHLVPAAGLMDCALEIARRIAANGPLAVRAARDAVFQGLSLPLDQALRLEQLHAEPLRQSRDAAEGVRAFVEKRAPNFTGQ
ncbi:MAG: enoyl-CoA hydratase/isomerase family protein [Rhizobiaceae bacterium]|nr:MAG: enoyl-CoA hydratase/isomerase family protein [Rhizobiaceae bacterium]CAG0949309.1 enoyl-CoA hydratase [Rhizobiaceae bacterium]